MEYKKLLADISREQYEVLLEWEALQDNKERYERDFNEYKEEYDAEMPEWIEEYTEWYKVNNKLREYKQVIYIEERV